MAKRAKDVRYGDLFVTKRNGKGEVVATSPVKRLAEVCAKDWPKPHVHIVHGSGDLCAGFNALVDVLSSPKSK